MNKISSVVIDDEYLNRKLITLMVTSLHPDFVIAGEAENIREGYELINRIKPDVVFLDIKMPDGSGFDLLKSFSKIDFELVFITGFDEYALLAFEFNALDYVLKPIDTDKFKLTLEKVQNRLLKPRSESTDLEKIISSYDGDKSIITKIPVHHNNEVVLRSVKDILYIQAESGNSLFITQSGEHYLSSKQLSDFDFILKNFPGFVKIRKDITININYIHSYSKGFTCNITMNNGLKIEIPRRKKTKILQLLQNKI